MDKIIKNKYFGITHNVDITEIDIDKWKDNNCANNIHLFDEVLSYNSDDSPEHYLICDVCQLVVNIKSISLKLVDDELINIIEENKIKESQEEFDLFSKRSLYEVVLYFTTDDKLCTYNALNMVELHDMINNEYSQDSSFLGYAVKNIKPNDAVNFVDAMKIPTK